MKWIEIEIRLLFKNSKKIDTWLKNNAKYIDTKIQIDTYYEPQNRSYIYDENGAKNADEWLRLREYSNKVEINYKHWHRDKKTRKSLYADEIETIVGSKEDMEKILTFLKFKKISIIDKVRDTWQYKNFEITRDDVKNLGKFYEIEFQGNLDNPENGKQLIFDFLDRIGIKEYTLIDRGYPWMDWNRNLW